MKKSKNQPSGLAYDMRDLKALIHEFSAPVRMQSPASLYLAIYEGCRALHYGCTEQNMKHLIRMNIEMERMSDSGHFPQSGAGQRLTLSTQRLGQYILAMHRFFANNHSKPKWTQELNQDTKDVARYFTDYVKLYADLNGHLPLIGPYCDKPEHPWDKSPWKVSSFDNTLTR